MKIAVSQTLQPHFKCSVATCGQGLRYHPTQGFTLLQNFPLAAWKWNKTQPTLWPHLHRASPRRSVKSLQMERSGSWLRNGGRNRGLASPNLRPACSSAADWAAPSSKQRHL